MVYHYINLSNPTINYITIFIQEHNNLEFKSRDLEFKNRDLEFQSRDLEFQSQDIELKSRDLEFQSRDLEFQSRDLEFKDYYEMALIELRNYAMHAFQIITIT